MADCNDKDQDYAQKKVADQILNPCSPYYLHPGENPDLVLVSQTLNETNYSTWNEVGNVV